ncbi:MAG: cardiolipin synthase [Anaerovoracaceae bacterium]
MNEYINDVFTISNLMTTIYVINIFISLAIIFLERKNPTTTLAWILILFFIPVVGFVLYIVLAQNISRQKIFRITAKEQKVIDESLKEQIREMDENTYEFKEDVAARWKHMIKLNQVYGYSYFTQNNDVEIFDDGKRMFHNLIKDIRNAKDTINVMYYIIKDDMVGRKMIDALTQKAKEGLEVRMLVDTLGSRYITNRKLKEYLNAGGKIAYFFKPKLKLINMKLNYRNHRKIVVIDGEVGYVGGFNIANEYLGFKKKFGYWRDTHVKIMGGAVQDLNARFIVDWRFASKEEIDITATYYTPVENRGNTGVQIVSCGPDSQKEEIKRGLMKMITYAEKRVFLQSPYFVPDASLLESLKMAVQSGVDVRIMIPCMPDHLFVYWATYAYVGELLRSGAKVYIYDRGFLHAKTMVVDGEVTSVGSANFDRRSFRLNFEANAFIYDEDIAKKMEKLFYEDMKHGHELTYEMYLNRSTMIKFKEAISRLLSDVL